MYKTIYTEVKVEVDLCDFNTNDLIEELESRGKIIVHDYDDPIENKELINDIFHKRRAGQDYQRELDHLIYNTIGRFA